LGNCGSVREVSGIPSEAVPDAQTNAIRYLGSSIIPAVDIRIKNLSISTPATKRWICHLLLLLDDD
jgi:hypothetical protein